MFSLFFNELTIERINVDGNYEPDNCTFISLAEQQNNKRNNVNLAFDGDTKTIAEWIKDTRCICSNRSKLGWRIRVGWPVDKAITTY